MSESPPADPRVVEYLRRRGYVVTTVEEAVAATMKVLGVGAADAGVFVSGMSDVASRPWSPGG